MFFAVPATMAAQSGMLDDRTESAVITGVGLGNAHGPLLAIVLWPGDQPGWMHPRNEFDRVRTDSTYRCARLRADEARWHTMLLDALRRSPAAAAFLR